MNARIPRARWAGLLWAGTILVSVVGCIRLGFDRESMLGVVADTVVLPAHLALTEGALELDGAARSFAEGPSPETLEALRASWREVQLAWKRVELYEFPGLLLIHNAIERRPARVAFIEQVIAEAADDSLEALDADFVESLGSTTKGLGAIEYLIFPSEDQPEPVLESFDDPARGAFLTALTSNLIAKSGELYDYWQPEGGNYAQAFRENDSEGSDIQGSVSLLANRMIELHEMVLRVRLGMPMGQTTDGVPQPSEVESFGGSASLEMMTASIESLRDTFAAGLDDYVLYLERSPPEGSLSAAIHSQFGAVLDALAAVPPPLQAAVLDAPAEVMRAYEAMEGLLVLLKTDMSAVLGITVTFSDADGD